VVDTRHDERRFHGRAGIVPDFPEVFKPLPGQITPFVLVPAGKFEQIRTRGQGIQFMERSG
jgi:hypothetical protein